MEININDLTIGQLKEITNLVSCGKNDTKLVISFNCPIVTGKQIGRASCRERV